jgi:hypothetical protein
VINHPATVTAPNLTVLGVDTESGDDNLASPICWSAERPGCGDAPACVPAYPNSPLGHTGLWGWRRLPLAVVPPKVLSLLPSHNERDRL